MDKKRAFEILGLREDATKEIIVKRYNVLFKKFKHSDAEDLGYTREELDKAYKLLMGYEYRDPEEERKKMARQQNPNPILKALGIDYDRLSNFYITINGKSLLVPWLWCLWLVSSLA